MEFKVGDERSTRQRVVRSILAAGSATAADLASELDVTPAAIRRHLDALVEEGLIASRDARHSARGRGRPAKEFVITELGRGRFDQQYDELAMHALRFLAQTGGDDAIKAFAQQRVSFIERDYAAVAAANPDFSPAQVLAKVLSDEGYEAGVRHLPLAASGEQLCQQHCPVSHVAHEFPQLCQAETEAIAKVVGSHVQRLATIAHGDGVCTTCIPDVPRKATS